MSDVSESQVVQQLCTLEKSSPGFSRVVYTFIRLDENGEYSLNLQESDSARPVDFLDEVLLNRCASSFHEINARTLICLRR